MDRRSYLKTLAATGALASVGAVLTREPPSDRETDGRNRAPRPSVTPTSDDTALDRFDTVVDVGKVGADDTGTEPVDPVLDEHAADDTLLRFPPGRYRVDHVRLEDLSNFGMVGDDATLVIGRPGAHAFLIFRRVADVLLEGFTVDSTAKNTVAWIDFRCVGGRNAIRDYEVRGFGDVAERTNGFTLMVEGQDTSLTVERADLSDGAKNGAGTFVFPRKDFTDPSREPGALTFRDCVMEGWGKEGLYASPHGGPLRVVGGEYANNAIVQVRVGGGNAPTRTRVDGVRVRVDEVPSYTPERNRVFRGIWLEEGDLATVANCDLDLASVRGGSVQAGITVNEQFGRATIRDCRIRTADPSPAISIEQPLSPSEMDEVRTPSLDHLPQRWTVSCRNVHIEGTAPGAEAILLRGRDGCRFRNVTVRQRAKNADGIRLVDADGCVLAGGSVVVPRFPGVVDATGRSDRSCRLALRGVTRFEGTDVEGGEVLAERRSVDLLPQFPPDPDLPGEYCLDDEVVARLLRSERQVLALTGVREGALYGEAVPYRTLEEN